MVVRLIRSRPVLSSILVGALAFTAGWNVKKFKDWVDYNPSIGIGEIKPMGDMNGDGVPDLMITTYPDNLNHLAYGKIDAQGKPNGSYIGSLGIQRQYSCLDSQVNERCRMPPLPNCRK